MIKIVQFGEGNFLRTFVDLYFDTLNKEGGDYKVNIVKPISFGNPGEIRINDVVWTAITADENESVPQGAVVTVKALKGNKYIVEVKNA